MTASLDRPLFWSISFIAIATFSSIDTFLLGARRGLVVEGSRRAVQLLTVEQLLDDGLPIGAVGVVGQSEAAHGVFGGSLELVA